MLNFIRENINGILGTVVFHLLIIVVFMAARLSSVPDPQEESMLIEFELDVSEEEFRALTESLMAERDNLQQENQSHQQSRNIAVNVSEERPIPDNFREMSSEQLENLDQRMNDILNDAANGIMPELEQPEFNFEQQPEIISQEDHNSDEPYKGPTTITYDLQGRNHLRIPVPVYKCPDGGIVEVNIDVDKQGRVIRATIDGNPTGFNEICIFETAIEASMASRFEEKSDAPPVQTGTITFYFQHQ